MSDAALHVMLVVGSLRQGSATRAVLLEGAAQLEAAGCTTDLLDLSTEPLPLYNPDTAHAAPRSAPLKARVDRADVFLLGSPDYHGSISSPLKNFLDHFWHEFAGRLFVTLVASHEKGLTATDQLRTVACQCYAWTLPYGLSFAEDTDVQDGRIANPKLAARLAMLVRDVRVYGSLLAQQRRADLAGIEPGFMARWRPRS
ncbi:MAG: NAD(P)H-dependent oxidoreductase [Verrucomicrobia bacterium]|nr:NAD(P)H-dependent oxidoreductase [Verrucomicrobiota bacterium]